MNEKKAEAWFESLMSKKQVIKKYNNYWRSITPLTNDDVFKRYLFAFCSVHTNWKNNLSGYNAIKDFNQWKNDKFILNKSLKESGVGMHNMRTEYIWAFNIFFWMDPNKFQLIHKSKDYHSLYRDELVSDIKGLGHAKVSFALEMIDPLKANIVCGDIHQLRLYGIEGTNYKTSKGLSLYKSMENHWIACCEAVGVSPYIARCIYWDELQKQEDTRYWSHVLETN